MRCSKCGAECKEGQIFCLNCGNPIGKIADLDDDVMNNENDLTNSSFSETETSKVGNETLARGSHTSDLTDLEDDIDDVPFIEDEENFPKDMDISRMMPGPQPPKHNVHVVEPGRKTRMNQVEIDETEDEDLYREPQHKFEDKDTKKSKLTGKRTKKKKSKMVTTMEIIFIVVLLVGASFLAYQVIFGHSDRKFNEYYNNGMTLYDGQNMERAASEFLRADNVAYNDDLHIKAKTMIYKSYENSEKYDDAINVLNDLIKIDPNNEEFSIALMKIYQKQGKADRVQEILDKAAGTELGDKLDEYNASMPVADNKGGNFEHPVTVTLTTIASNKIYYTVDGTDPTEKSEEYTEPLVFGSNGEFDLKAVAASPKGILSEVMTEHYVIHAVTDPVVSPDSGDYDTMTKIVIEVPSGFKAYYTMDGTEPTNESSQYDGNLYMPIGNSLFSVVFYNSVNVKSNVVTKIYNLAPSRNQSYDEALKRLKTELVDAGIMKKLDGTWGTKKKIVFEYSADVVIDGEEYYLVKADKNDASGKAVGQAYYGISVYDGTVWKVTQKDDKYTLDTNLSIPKV